MTGSFELGDNMIGVCLGPYRIVKVVGRGGMGVVFEATAPHRAQNVALKVPHEEVANEEGYLRRFYHEARIASRVRHRHVVKTYDVGNEGPFHYIAMEYVRGRPLSMIIRKEGRLAPKRSIRIAQQIANAMIGIHEAGIVHRDIKPKNIIADDRDRIKVLDFGIARVRFRERDETTGGHAGGSWAGSRMYLSPEQCLGKRADSRSDIYSLGITLFEMLTGRVPFNSDNPAELIYKITHDPLPDIKTEGPRIPYETQDILNKSLAKDPEARYADAAEMERDLLRLVNDLTTVSD